MKKYVVSWHWCEEYSIPQNVPENEREEWFHNNVRQLDGLVEVEAGGKDEAEMLVDNINFIGWTDEDKFMFDINQGSFEINNVWEA